ncbi:hypothetical protein ACSVDA_14270 [Cytobacillus sp. Hm23]
MYHKSAGFKVGLFASLLVLLLILLPIGLVSYFLYGFEGLSIFLLSSIVLDYIASFMERLYNRQKIAGVKL